MFKRIHVDDMSWHIVWHITVILWPWTNMLISLKIMSIHLLIFDLIKSIRTRTKNHFRTCVHIFNHSTNIDLWKLLIILAGNVMIFKRLCTIVRWTRFTWKIRPLLNYNQWLHSRLSRKKWNCAIFKIVNMLVLYLIWSLLWYKKSLFQLLPCGLYQTILY